MLLLTYFKNREYLPSGNLLAGFSLLSLLFSLLGPCAELGAAGEKRAFSIKSAIERAVSISPIAQGAEYKAERAGLDLRKFRMEKYMPRLKVRFTTGLVPEAKGDVLASEDNVNDLNGLAPFYKVDVEAFKPLYTFGMLGSAISAAKEGVKYEQSKRDMVIEDISLKVVKAYWAFYYASKAENLASDLKGSFEDMLKEVKGRLEDENSGVDDSDYLKLKASAFAVYEGYQKGVELKKKSVLFLFGLLDLTGDDGYEFRKENTPRFEITEEEKEQIYEISRQSSLLIKGVDSAVAGLKAKLDVSRSHRYPVIFLGAKFSYARAGNRTDQTNPFVVDNFNYRELGAALGVEWKPDFSRNNIEIQKSRLDYFSAMEKRKVVEVKVRMDAKQALFGVEKNKALMQAAKKSLKAAKTWLRISGDNWDMGIGELNRLIESYKTYYRLRGVEIDTESRYNASLADLAYASGGMKLYLKWLKDGRVSFD